MKLTRPGHALLFVLLTTSALMFYCLAIVRSSLYTSLIPRAQTKVMQDEYLVQGLLEYGIAFCSENKDTLFLDGIASKRDIILRAKRWPSLGKSTFSGTLTVKPIDNNKRKIRAQLFSDGIAVCEASCHATCINKSNGLGLRITMWNSRRK